MTNREAYTGFPTSNGVEPRFYAAPNFLKMGIKYLNLSSFIQVSTNKDEKSAAKFHDTKTVSVEVVAQSTYLHLLTYLLTLPYLLTFLHLLTYTYLHLHLRCTHFAS